MGNVDLWFDALGHFFGGRGDPGNELVRFGLAAFLWGTLFFIAWQRRLQSEARRERMLLWGFGFGFAREAFMFLAFLRDLFTPHPKPWHLVFPPLDHALALASVVLIAGAFIDFLRQDRGVTRQFLWWGIMVVTATYLATFLWWPFHLLEHPTAKLGQTWCDWLFHLAGVGLSIWALGLLTFCRGWLRNLVMAAITLFLLCDLLKIADIASGEQFEFYFAPVRHGLHVLAVFLFGLVYFREMQHQGKWLAAAVQNSIESIVILSSSRVIEYVNPVFCRYTGYTPAEVVGRRFNQVMVTPRHDEGFYRRFWDCLEGGQTWRGRTYTPRKGGGEFEGERQVTPLRNSHDEITGYVSVTRDTSKEREIERRLMQAQKMEAIGTLAGGIAHDFNNLLTPIMGFTEATKNKLPENDPLRTNLEHVMEASERAREMIGQILTISRKRLHEKQKMELLPLVKQALKLLRGSLPSTIEIHQSLLARHSLVHADASQMNQVLINLVTNAGQAMPDGGVLEVGLEEVVVDAEFVARHVGLEAGIFLCLSVRDSGMGMSAEVEDHIFEPFFTTRKESGGTGLGLAIVRGVVEDHEGAVEVESVYGEGTLFRIFLPLVAGQATATAVNKEFGRPGCERILLVDDENTVVVLGKQVLESLGYQVTSRASAVTALELVRQNPQEIDLLITDLTMPEMSGLALAEAVLELAPELPIMLCTGYLKEDTRQQASEAGIRVVMPKPYTMSELNRAIRHIFDET